MTLEHGLAEFLAHLGLEKNASPKTVKSYREDLTQALQFVRDRTGKILWSGDLRMTHSRKVVGLAPFKVETDNLGAIEVTVAGDPRGTLGTAGKAGSKRFD